MNRAKQNNKFKEMSCKSRMCLCSVPSGSVCQNAKYSKQIWFFFTSNKQYLLWKLMAWSPSC